MIVPNGEQGQQTRREGAMHGQMRTDNAVPILDRTTGPHRQTPDIEQTSRLLAPCRVHCLKQVLGLLSQNRPTLPCPSDESHRLFS